MHVSPILHSTSFGSLDIAGQKAVRALFDETYQSREGLKLNHLQLFRQRKSLDVSLAYFGSKLSQINPATFKFMNPIQKAALEQDLLFSFYIFSAQYQLDEAEHRRQGLQERNEQIKRCADLINKLRNAPNMGDDETPEQIHARAIDDSDKHVKYLGLTVLAPLIAEKMVEVTEGRVEQWESPNKTGVIKDWMGAVNGRRLYWVWANAMLSSVFAMLPQDFANNPQAKRAVGALSPVTGYMSWILYYTRFGINLSLLLKHTIAGPWMSEKEREVPVLERFKTQWDQRKFSLLNDSIWATANMACFLWLIGSGTLGYLGNVTTTALLLMDVGLTAWRFHGEYTQHNKEMLRYEGDLRALRDKIKTENDDEKKQLLVLQLDALLKAEKQCKVEWTYKKYGLVNDLAYATLLMIAFSLMCCFLFPPAMIAPATALILGLAGAAMCFVLNTAYAAVAGYMEMDKPRAKGRAAKEECKLLLKTFTDAKDDGVKKQLYLDMKQLMADSVYQDQLVHFQKLKMIQAFVIDVLVPPLVFVSFMFMPFGIGLAVLAAGFALAVIAHYILKSYAPDAIKMPTLDENEYDAFASLVEPTIGNITIDKEPHFQKNQMFFCQGKSAGNKPPSNDSLDDNSLVPGK